MPAVLKKPRLTGEAGIRDRRLRLNASAETHRIVRERFGRSPDPSAIDRVAALFDLPAWAEGSIGLVDAMFLYDMVQCTRPGRMIEIGVAGGVSSAILLRALEDSGLPVNPAGGASLIGFDIDAWCYFDRSCRVGGAVAEMAPELVHGYELHTGATALEAGRLLRGAGIELAFIDGDHRHPAPTIDLLALLPALRPGAWVILHDIDLPAAAIRYENAHGVRVDWHHAGAQYLYECWPFEKFRGEGAGINIGAIRVPADQAVQREHLAEAIQRPFEFQPTGEGAGLLGLAV